jgi:hypothetical protein
MGIILNVWWWKQYLQFHDPSGVEGHFQIRSLKFSSSNDEGETRSSGKGFDVPATLNFIQSLTCLPRIYNMFLSSNNLHNQSLKLSSSSSLHNTSPVARISYSILVQHAVLSLEAFVAYLPWQQHGISLPPSTKIPKIIFPYPIMVSANHDIICPTSLGPCCMSIPVTRGTLSLPLLDLWRPIMMR